MGSRDKSRLPVQRGAREQQARLGLSTGPFPRYPCYKRLKDDLTIRKRGGTLLYKDTSHVRARPGLVIQGPGENGSQGGESPIGRPRSSSIAEQLLFQDPWEIRGKIASKDFWLKNQNMHSLVKEPYERRTSEKRTIRKQIYGLVTTTKAEAILSQKGH